MLSNRATCIGKGEVRVGGGVENILTVRIKEAARSATNATRNYEFFIIDSKYHEDYLSYIKSDNE